MSDARHPAARPTAPGTRRAERIAWAAGALGLLLAGFAWVLAPLRFHYAWLAAYATWWGWPLGSIALILIHRLTGGRWGNAIGPALRTAAGATPVLVAASVPVVLGLAIYPWVTHPTPFNHFYLNVPFLMVRLACDLALWLLLALLVLRRDGPALACVGLPLLALSFTFACIDLTMSLEPQINSSVYGMLQGTAAVLFALSLATIPAALTAPHEVLAQLGKLLLSLLVLWAYLDFMQFLIFWESNLPNEAPYYVARMHGVWGWLFAGQAVLHFLLPLSLLLVPALQRSRRGITGVALLLVALEVLRGWWTVLPEVHGGGGAPGWIDLACLLSLGGPCAAWMLRNLPAADAEYV